MKKKLLTGLATGLFLVGVVEVASATTITYGGISSDGIETSSIAGALVETFNSAEGVIGSASAIIGALDQQSWTWSGAGTVYPAYTNVSGLTAAPAFDESNFLSVPNPNSDFSLTASLGATYDYFGLFWGSVDTYNSISFSLKGEVTETFDGTDLIVWNGNQIEPESNLYVNFMDMQNFDSFTMKSTRFAFEVDNIAVGNSPVPEPATMLLFGTGLVGLAGSRIRKKKK